MAKLLTEETRQLDKLYFKLNQIDGVTFKQLKDEITGLKRTITSMQSIFSGSDEDIKRMLNTSSEINALYSEINRIINETTEKIALYNELMNEISEKKKEIQENEEKELELLNKKTQKQQELKDLMKQKRNGTFGGDDDEYLTKKAELVNERNGYEKELNKILSKRKILNDKEEEALKIKQRITDEQAKANTLTHEARQAQSLYNEKLEESHKKIGEITAGLKAAWGVLKDTATKWIEFDDMTVKVGRSMGMNADQVKSFRKHSLEANKQLALAYGMTNEELMKFQEDYAKSTNRAIVLTQEQKGSLAAMSKIVKETATNDMVNNMDRFGGSIDEASMAMALNTERARAYGLDAQKSGEAFAKNINMASKFNFKNGINGISKMTNLSQRLKFNMESIGNAAEKFQTIESSIETAAQLQMLGGSMAANFSNPLEAMNMALTDMEGFTNKVIDSFQGKAYFNQKTGQMDMSAIDKAFLRETAKTLGISYDEAWNMAVQGKKGEEIGKSIKDSSMDESQKEWIKNQAQYIDGEWQVKYLDGEKEQTAKVSELNSQNIDKIRATSTKESQMQDDVHTISKLLQKKFEKEARALTSERENITGTKTAFDNAKMQAVEPVMDTLKDVHRDTNNGEGILGWVNDLIMNNPLLALGGHMAVASIGAKALPKYGGKAVNWLEDKWTKRKLSNSGSGVTSDSSTSHSTGTSTSSRSSSSSGKSVKTRFKRGLVKGRNAGAKGLKGVKNLAGKVKNKRAAVALTATALALTAFGATRGGDNEENYTPNVEGDNNENNSMNNAYAPNVESEAVESTEVLNELTKQTELLQTIAEKLGVEHSVIENITNGGETSEETTDDDITSEMVEMGTDMVKDVATTTAELKIAQTVGTKVLPKVLPKLGGAANPLGALGTVAGIGIDMGNELMKANGLYEEGSWQDSAMNIGSYAAQGAGIGSVIPGVGSAVGAVIGAVYGVADQFGEGLDKKADELLKGDTFDQIEGALLKVGSTGLLLVKDTFDTFGGAVSKVVGGVVDGISSMFDTSSDEITYKRQYKASLVDQYQFERTKMGGTNINDPALMQKAALSTIQIHDLLISQFNKNDGLGEEGKSVEEIAEERQEALEGHWYDGISNFFGFSKGGIVQESKQKLPNEVNDTALAKVSPKEMILTEAQQANLWQLANGEGTLGQNYGASVVSVPTVGIREEINKFGADRSASNDMTLKPFDCNLNINGTLTVRGERGGSEQVDIASLIRTQAFKDQFMSMVFEEINRRNNQGKGLNRNSVMGISGSLDNKTGR